MPLAKFFRYFQQIDEIEYSKTDEAKTPAAAFEQMIRKAKRNG